MTERSPKVDIRPDHWEIVQGILKKHVPQHEVWAFGSRVKWTAKEYSDLDLAVITDKPLSLHVSANLSDDFSESDLPYKVDVVDWATTSESFRKIIERDRVVVQQKGQGCFMASETEWFVKPLGEVTDNHDGKRRPVKESERKKGAFPYYGASGVVDQVDGYLFDGSYLLIAEDGENLRTRQTPIAFMAHGKFWVNNHAHIVTGTGDVSTEYLHYFLQVADIQPYLTGAVMPKLTQGNLNRIPVQYPSPSHQRGIVKVLKALDDKIAVNRRINQILEAMAQAIFKSWFVDFDPVKAKITAKAEGSDPLRAAMTAISGKPDAELDTLPPEQLATLAATAALFPDEMEDSELGEIPKGWKNSTLGELCRAFGGLIQTGPFGSQLHAHDYTSEGVPVVMPQDLSGRRISIEKIARIGELDAERLQRHRMQVGDIVFSRRGDVGRHALVTPLEIGWLCGTGCLLVRPSTGEKISAYVSCALAQADALEWLARHAVGATMPNLNTIILSNLPIVLAPSTLMSGFQNRVGAMEAAMNLSIAEIATLSEVRDALLPRLLSGELHVHNTEVEVAA